MFNSHLANAMFGVSTETQLREKIYCTRSDLTEVEKNTITNFLSKFASPTYCEVGVYFGGNFDHVLAWLINNKESFHCFGVDLFESLAAQSQENQTHDLYNKWNILNVAYRDDLESALSSRSRENFTLLAGNSDTVVSNMQESCDVYFLDGNHTYEQTMKDAEACIAKSKAGAYLIFHNASKNIPPDDQYVKRDGGPYKVCKDLLTRPNVEFVGLYDRCCVLTVIDD